MARNADVFMKSSRDLLSPIEKLNIDFIKAMCTKRKISAIRIASIGI